MCFTENYKVQKFFLFFYFFISHFISAKTAVLMDCLEQEGVLLPGGFPVMNRALTQHAINSTGSPEVPREHVDFYSTAHRCLSPWQSRDSHLQTHGHHSEAGQNLYLRQRGGFPPCRSRKKSLGSLTTFCVWRRPASERMLEAACQGGCKGVARQK